MRLLLGMGAGDSGSVLPGCGSPVAAGIKSAFIGCTATRFELALALQKAATRPAETAIGSGHIAQSLLGLRLYA
ncbi:hypothetical protein D3C85_854820 [compost metagenome]|jgi:hypothetical protein